MTKAAGHGALGIAAEVLETALAELQDVVSPEGATASGKRRRAGLLRETGHHRPGRKEVRREDGESRGGRQWRGRWSDFDMAQPTPPRCRQDSRKRAAEWEELDRLEVELMERKVRLGARPHQRRGEARLAAA